MRRFRAVSIVVAGVLVLGLASVALGMKEQPKPIEPPDYAIGRLPVSSPFVILQQGETTWVQVYPDTSHCPGDPLGGHGGEAEGGPDGSETWCFEGFDSCGAYDLCFDHEDVRSFPSQTGVNFWHLSDYVGAQTAPDYIGSYCMWCGSDSLWIDGNPVECGTWVSGRFPGYGNQWNCIVELSLPDTFTTVSGCTLYFDPRYDTECKYDYFYVDFWTGSEWYTLATFNASSNNPGSECGAPTGGNPDYWGNTDTGQPNSAGWQTRAVQDEPAFKMAIDAVLDSIPENAPRFRWRFTSDGAWSDADGRGNTDGAAYIDNVWVVGDPGKRYEEDFEVGDWTTLQSRGWSLVDPEGVAQAWHLVHDPDPPYEGGDGGDRTTCLLDSSIVWRARPEGGYPGGAAWRNGWFYRLKTPALHLDNTGAVVQYDQYMCALDYTCDYTDTKVRFYDTAFGQWCPWINIDGFIIYGGCFFWNFDRQEDVTPFFGPTADSMQFAWDLMDVSNPGDFCRGKHKKTDNIVDNVSVGFFDGNATIFSARVIDIFQDSFFDSLPLFNSFFDAYDPDTVAYYSGPPYTNTLPFGNQLYVTVTDKNNVNDVRLYGSVDKGATWQYVTMDKRYDYDPNHPELGGDYTGTFYPTDFGLTRWDKGTEIWYFVWCQDGQGNEEYFPAEANPANPDHTGEASDYFTVSIMPMFPETYTGVRILLVDGYGRRNYDYAPCMASDDNIKPLEDIYEETLRDAGYCYDKFDISGAGSNIHIHPVEYGDYDAVVWFTGPYFSNYLFDAEAQRAIQNYIQTGGKVVLCGDRIAYNMEVVGEDSLGGEFLHGIMGCTYQEEMESAFAKPYLYLQAAPTISVFGTPKTINPTFLDSLVIYRECPYLKDMSYILTDTSPSPGYTAQALLYVLNPSPEYDPADGAIYVEHENGGQCVFINYDLCASVNHTRTYCDGSAPPGRPTFAAGYYYGRVELIRTILEELFGLQSNGTGGGGTSGADRKATFHWALSQNTPNPMTASTNIRFEVARTSDVSIKVYNAMGQLVKTLKNQRLDPGRYSVDWDGTNASGQRVSSGVYFYKMETKDYQATRKMLVLK